jgi:hypothetical protein
MKVVIERVANLVMVTYRGSTSLVTVSELKRCSTDLPDDLEEQVRFRLGLGDEVASVEEADERPELPVDGQPQTSR